MFDVVASSALVLSAAVEGELVERELPIPAIGFGLIAIVGFLILLGITYSFRTVAHRR